MPRSEKYYVVEFTNVKLDSHIHTLTLGVDSEANPRDYLVALLMHNPNLRIDLDQKLASFDSKAEADAEGRRRGEVATQVSPERVSAIDQFPPGQANRAIALESEIPHG